MKILKSFALLIIFIIPSTSYGVDVIMANPSSASKTAIYNTILDSIKRDFDIVNIIKEDELHTVKEIDQPIYVIGGSLFDKIKNLDNLQSNSFILVGAYKPPQDFNKFNNWKMISLFIDPEYFYNLIQSKLINSKNIYIIHNSNINNDWFTSTFKKFDKVQTIEVNSFKNAIISYRELFKTLEKGDIVLLSPESFFDKIVFSEILKLSWKYKIHTSSVLPSHTKKGILLSPLINFEKISGFFNDYYENFDDQKKIKGIPSEHASGNNRIAKHLGFSRKQIKTMFDRLY